MIIVVGKVLHLSQNHLYIYLSIGITQLLINRANQIFLSCLICKIYLVKFFKPVFLFYSMYMGGGLGHVLFCDTCTLLQFVLLSVMIERQCHTLGDFSWLRKG